MSKPLSVSRASLAAIVTLAGVGPSGSASADSKEGDPTRSLDQIDDESAARIIRVLFGQKREGLPEILAARSFEELSAAQTDTLDEVIQLAAFKLEMSEKPIV